MPRPARGSHACIAAKTTATSRCGTKTCSTRATRTSRRSYFWTIKPAGVCCDATASRTRRCLLGAAPVQGVGGRELPIRIGGPHMIRLPDGRILVAGRSYEGRRRTRLWEVDLEKAELTELLLLLRRRYQLPRSGLARRPTLDELLPSHEGRRASTAQIRPRRWPLDSPGSPPAFGLGRGLFER